MRLFLLKITTNTRILYIIISVFASKQLKKNRCAF
jgi:hypothetical protein